MAILTVADTIFLTIMQNATVSNGAIKSGQASAWNAAETQSLGTYQAEGEIGILPMNL